MSEQSLKNIGTWLLEGDTGTSSLSLCAIYLGGKSKNISAPIDSGDFYRCVKFLHKISAEEVYPLLDKIASQNSNWTEIRKEWDNLIFLYNRQEYVKISKKLSELYIKRENEIVVNL